MKSKKILIIGIGNDLRGDDSLGHTLVNNFNLKKFKKNNILIEKLVVRYLDYDISEKLIEYDVV
ncbi:MAG: hypothetical protein ACPL1F_06440, partial [bacterium]